MPSARRTCVVVTTIFPPSAAIYRHIGDGPQAVYDLVIVGDRKTPEAPYRELSERFESVHFLGLAEQEALAPRFSKLVPLDHYARKNLGYLYAIRAGYEIVAECDDDNEPANNWLEQGLADAGDVLLVRRKEGAGLTFCNVYRFFTDRHVWPRGFPLECILQRDEQVEVEECGNAPRVSVWQGLVDGSIDTDAIFRLTRQDAADELHFEAGSSRVVLDAGVVCPFNTQNTWWIDARTFPLLYVPSTTTFRVCDILKSYVAQHCLWRQDARVGFTQPTAFQRRNPHDLFTDFESEIPLYRGAATWNRALAESASGLVGDPGDLARAYRVLAAVGAVQGEELRIVDEWLELVSRA